MNNTVDRLIRQIEQETKDSQSFDISRIAKAYGFGGFTSFTKNAEGCYLLSKGLFGSRKTPLRGFWHDFYDVDTDELQDFLEEILDVVRRDNDISECDVTPSFVGGHRADISKNKYEGRHDREPLTEWSWEDEEEAHIRAKEDHDDYWEDDGEPSERQAELDDYRTDHADDFDSVGHRIPCLESNGDSDAYDTLKTILQNSGNGSPESQFIILKHPLRTIDSYFGNITVVSVGLDDKGEVLFITDEDDEISLYEASEAFCRKVLAAVQESEQSLNEVVINGFEGDYADDYRDPEPVDPQDADWKEDTQGNYTGLSKLFKRYSTLGVDYHVYVDNNEETRKEFCYDPMEGVFDIRPDVTEDQILDFLSREDVQAFLAREDGFDEDKLYFTVTHHHEYYGDALIVSWKSDSNFAQNLDNSIDIIDPDILQESCGSKKKFNGFRMNYVDTVEPCIL